MSKFDLRDISQRLSESKDTEAVVFEFLGYLQAVRSDWRASLAFYEVSRDALVNIYERNGSKLAKRDVTLSVDQLPPRLVRKFFHPSAFFNGANRRSLLSSLFQSSPFYEPDPLEAGALKPLTGPAHWTSCICMPLADQDDLLALLTITSEKKGAFGSRIVGDLMPLRSMAALALAQHLYRAARPADANGANSSARAAAADFQERIRRLSAESENLAVENQAKTEKLQVLSSEIELLDKNSTEYKQELEQVKNQLFALEEQSVAATHHLTEAHSQLNETQSRMGELGRTVGFLKDVFQVLSQEHDGQDFSATMVAWFSENFGVERCSLMLLDATRETLRITAHRGLDPGLAARVRVRVGQGIAGWVAHNRKPLFVRVRKDATAVQHTFQDAYNSDSFICVPMVHNNRLLGVLNLSNKHDGQPFDELDLDRAMLAGSVLAMTVGSQDTARRATAWAA